MRNLIAAAAIALPLQAFAAITASMSPSVPSPQPLATSVTWTVTASDVNPGVLTYRFTLVKGSTSRIVRDYSQSNTFTWSSSINEGAYRFQVTVRNNSTNETVDKSVNYTMSSRATGGQVVTAGANPLVALVSVPACGAGTQVRVKFNTPGGNPDYTNWRLCDATASTNIYVAGMYANTQYVLTPQTLVAGTITTGRAMGFKTGAAPTNIPLFTTPVAPNNQTSFTDNVVVSDFINFGGVPGYPTATDLLGNVIWYYAAFNDPSQQGALLTRVVPGGTMLVIANGANSNNTNTTAQLLREIDLAGNTLRETNATRITEQLVAMGQTSNCVTGGSVCLFGNFHHEAIRLPNGHTMAFGDVEKMYPAGTQGSTGPVDIIGDIIVELDENFQVVWSWNAFDHLDVNRAAVLGETCSPTTGGCSRLFLATTGNDWLHGNSLMYTADHNLIMSLRHQDWVIKIAYADGTADGHVIWHLGNQGDFSIASSDPWPWFSHQHDAGFESTGVLSVFDDGNTRVAQTGPANSRGQVYNVNETTMVATPVVNSDLGVYSFALGSAQLLSNGNYHFLPGINSGSSGNFSQSVEVLPTGAVNYRLQTPTVAYRSFRMKSLYTPPGT